MTTQYRLDVVSGTRDFTKARGFMVLVGTSTTTGSSQTFYAEITVPP